MLVVLGLARETLSVLLATKQRGVPLITVLRRLKPAGAFYKVPIQQGCGATATLSAKLSPEGALRFVRKGLEGRGGTVVP